MVANNAFINQLFSHRIKLENLEVNGTTEHGAIYGGERYTADGEINDNSTEETQGFHLSSNGLLQANKAILKNIDAQGGNFENITATGGEFNDIVARNMDVDEVKLSNLFIKTAIMTELRGNKSNAIKYIEGFGYTIDFQELYETRQFIGFIGVSTVYGCDICIVHALEADGADLRGSYVDWSITSTHLIKTQTYIECKNNGYDYNPNTRDYCIKLNLSSLSFVKVYTLKIVDL